MPRRYKRTPGSRTYTDYRNSDLEEALQKIQNDEMSQRQASKTYKIPRGTLQNKLKHQHVKNIGGQTILHIEEEQKLADYVILLSEYGFPLDTMDLRKMVQMLLNNAGKSVAKFKDNLPGYEWVRSFLSRHRNVTERFAQNIKKVRAEITPGIINQYFDHLEKELENIPPTHIWNFDETNLSDDPGKKKVLMKRGTRYPERILNSSKQSTSVMFCGNADGEVLPPYVVYKATHLYDTWRENGPKGTRYNRTNSGWFEGVIFEDFFLSHLLPRLKQDEGVKVVLCDNLASHISVKVLEACAQNNVRFVCFPPNTTHLTQPLDVAYFRSLKHSWRKILNNYKETCSNKTVPKNEFPKLLKKLMDDVIKGSDNLKSGFRKAGIYPINRTEVLNRLPTGRIEPGIVDNSVKEFLETRRYGAQDNQASTVKKKKKLQVEAGKSIVNLESNLSTVAGTSGNRRRMTHDQRDVDGGSERGSESPQTEVEPDENSSDEERTTIDNEHIVEIQDENEHMAGTSKTDIETDTFVIFKYEDQMFAGKVIEKVNKRYKISAMQKSGLRYKFPTTKDILWYDHEDILGVIETPTFSKRGFATIEKMKEFECFET